MNKGLRVILIIILAWSVYHVIRDVLQISEVDNLFATILHTPHAWCAPVCDYVAFPPEIFNIIAASVVLKRNYFGKLGKAILASTIIMILMWVIP